LFLYLKKKFISALQRWAEMFDDLPITVMLVKILFNLSTIPSLHDFWGR
jgi:hypothetical protein